MEAKTQEELWTALEVAVRTYAEPLPVDVFLPEPKEEVSRIMQERAEKRRPTLPEEPHEVPPRQDSLQELVEATEIIEPSPPINEVRSLDEELRSRLSGNSFAELDDV